MRTWHEDLLETRVWRPEAAHLLGKPETVPRACRPPDGCGMSRLRLQVSRGGQQRSPITRSARLSLCSQRHRSVCRPGPRNHFLVHSVAWRVSPPGALEVSRPRCSVQVLKVGVGRGQGALSRSVMFKGCSATRFFSHGACCIHGCRLCVCEEELSPGSLLVPT